MRLRGIDGDDWRLVSAMIEKTDINALENLSPNFLHGLVTAVDDGDVDIDGLSVLEQLYLRCKTNKNFISEFK